jgi:hypothetical protein
MFAASASHAHYSLPLSIQSGRQLVAEIALEDAMEKSQGMQQDLRKRGLMRMLHSYLAKSWATWRWQAQMRREHHANKFAASRTHGGIGMIGYLDYVLIPVFAHLQRVMPDSVKGLMHLVEYRTRLVQVAATQADGKSTAEAAQQQANEMLRSSGIDVETHKLGGQLQHLMQKAVDDIVNLQRTAAELKSREHGRTSIGDWRLKKELEVFGVTFSDDDDEEEDVGGEGTAPYLEFDNDGSSLGAHGVQNRHQGKGDGRRTSISMLFED